MPGATRSRGPRGGVRLTDRDRELLGFAAEHRLVLERQVARLVGSSVDAAAARLRDLDAAGYLVRRQLFSTESAYCQIRSKGLAAIASDLRAPRLKLADYRHDVGVAWLWLAAYRGTFGAGVEVLGERRLRSHDAALRGLDEPYAVYLGGVDRRGDARLHYPDLLLIDPHGRRLALELELSFKEPSRRERILSGYAADPRVDGVLYLVEDDTRGRAIGRAITATARRTYLLDRLHLQLIKPIEVASTHRGGRDGRVREPARVAAP